MIKIADYGYALGSGAQTEKRRWVRRSFHAGGHPFFHGLTVVALIEEINGVLGKIRKKT